MFVIGLTGGIGTGKSQVAKILEDLGAAAINADLLGHEAYLPNTVTWQKIVDTFGKEVLSPGGEVDRKKLGGVVFGDPGQLERLNAIMFPRIYQMIEERIAGLDRDGRNTVVVEAALFLEAKWDPLAAEIWVTVSSEDAVVERLKSRNNFTEEAIKARIASQMPQDERVARADVVIDNDIGMDELRRRVEQLFEERVHLHKETISQT
jgi:dephospho-CoA kinase